MIFTLNWEPFMMEDYDSPLRERNELTQSVKKTSHSPRVLCVTLNLSPLSCFPHHHFNNTNGENQPQTLWFWIVLTFSWGPFKESLRCSRSPYCLNMTLRGTVILLITKRWQESLSTKVSAPAEESRCQMSAL